MSSRLAGEMRLVTEKAERLYLPPSLILASTSSRVLQNHHTFRHKHIEIYQVCKYLGLGTLRSAYL